ncbi:phosphorylase family protein [Thermopirellula anaerolimosa]
MVLHPWIRSQIQATAGEALRQALSESLHGPDRETDQAGPGDGRQTVPEFSARVGIVVALPSEADPLRRRMENPIELAGDGFSVSTGRIGGCSTAIIRAGPGAESARRAASALLIGHRPRYVLAAGFAGGLVPDLRRYDILLPDVLLDDSGKKLRLDTPRAPGEERPTSDGARMWKTGPLLTVPRVVREPEEKRRLADDFGAWAVDMETFAVAEVCRAAKVPMLAVRVISDTCEDRLSKEVEYLLAKRHVAQQVGFVAGAVLRRWATIKELWRLYEYSVKAGDRLADFLVSVLPSFS